MKGLLEKLKRKEQVTIVALGDSNTELTWHTVGRLNWVGLLQYALFEKYGTNRTTVINAGRCGDTAVGGFARLDRDVIRFQPDLVIVSFGMNEAGQGEAGLAILGRDSRDHLWNRMSDAVHPGALGHLHFYRELAPLFELPTNLPWET